MYSGFKAICMCRDWSYSRDHEKKKSLYVIGFSYLVVSII